MASYSVAARIADDIPGSTTDEVFQILRGLDDETAVSRFLDDSGRLEQVGGGLERITTRGVEVGADQPRRIADTALSTGQKTLLGGGAIAGGTFVGSKYLETEQQRLERLATQDQSQALQEIMNDPHLSAADKQSLVDKLAGQGFFERPSSGGGGDGGGFVDRIIGGIFGDLGLVEFLVLIMLVYFGGKAMVQLASSGSGGGSS